MEKPVRTGSNRENANRRSFLKRGVAEGRSKYLFMQPNDPARSEERARARNRTGRLEEKGMKFVRRLVLASVALSILAGGHVARLWAQAAASTFVYVTNYRANSVSGYAVDASTGILTPVQGSPFATGVQPYGVAADPSGRFLYVANDYGSAGGGDLSAYAIDGTTGALMPLPGSPVRTRFTFPRSVAIEPSGHFLYLTNNWTGSIEAFTIDAATGALAPVAGSPFAGTAGSYAVASIDPSGRFLFVPEYGDPCGSGGRVWVSLIDPASGALTPAPGSPFLAGKGTWAVAADASSKFVYAANYLGQDISAYTLDATTGTLTPLPGSPFSAGPNASPRSISVDPTGRFLYTANFVNTIPYNGYAAAFTIDGATGGLTPVTGSPFSTGKPTVAGALDPSGQFFIAVNSYDRIEASASAFTVDGATGALTEAPGSPLDTGAGTLPLNLGIARVARP